MVQKDSSSYFLNAERLVEASRLVNQDRFVTETTGLLPSGIDSNAIYDVLDIGSGPGGWLLDLVMACPHIRGTGIDTSDLMLRISELLTQAEGKNITFRKMDAREPLGFPDALFDFIQMRLNHSFLRPHMWPAVLKECYRLLKDGGWLRVTDLEIILTNKQSTEELYARMPLVWSKAHLSMSPTGRSLGMLTHMKPLFRSAGFTGLELQLYALDNSYGEKHYTAAREDTAMVNAAQMSFYVKHGYSEEHMTELFERVTKDMEDEDYTNIAILVSCWGRKPETVQEED